MITKDPEEPPAEIVDFQEVYSDINTPEYWIAENEEDLSPKLIVMDGHSSIIVYTKDTDDLHWEAVNELGQYSYEPKTVGDGLITIPHTFYFEFDIELTDKLLHVSADFDGTGVKAIIMPLKDVTIENFFDAFGKRLKSVFSLVLKPSDDKLEIKEGEELVLTESMKSNLSLKLALMGIQLSRLKVKSYEEIEIEKTESVEKVFDTPPAKQEMDEEEIVVEEPTEDEEEQERVPPKPAASPPETGEVSVPTVEASSPPPMPGGAGSSESIPSPSDEVDVSKGGPPSPSSSAPPSPSSDAPPSTQKGAKPPTPPQTKEASDQTKDRVPPVTRSKKKEKPKTKRTRSASLQEEEAEQPVKEPSPPRTKQEQVEDSFIAKGMEKMSEQDVSLRNTHATWFDRMISNRTYPLAITVSTEEMKAKSSVTSHTTGERLSEATDTMEVDETDHIVEIAPSFPGCLVVPARKKIDLTTKKSTVRFHVTPLTRGEIEAEVNFIQSGRNIHQMELQSKIITHRISKWSTALGTLTGSLPAIMAFIFNQSPGKFLEERYETLSLSFLLGLGYLVPLLISLIFFGIGGGLYYLQSPKKRDRTVSFPR